MQETSFRLDGSGAEAGIQGIYAALAADEARNRLILDDVPHALEEGRSPILLTERRDHLEYFAGQLRGFVRHLVVLQGGMTAKERREPGDRLAAVPDNEERLVLATGRYIGEWFDDRRLDTLVLAMPVSWKGTLVQYTGVYTDFIRGSRRCGPSTTWTVRYRCWLGCSSGGCGRIGRSGTCGGGAGPLGGVGAGADGGV